MTVSAIQTFTSGKTKLIDLFVCKGEWLSWARQHRTVEPQPTFPGGGRSDGLLDGRQDKRTCRTAPLRGFFTELAMQVPRNVDARPNAVGLHLPSILTGAT